MSAIDIAEMEGVIQKACQSRQVAGAVAMASNGTGSFSYRRAFGPHSLQEPSRVMDEDAVMWIASCTKLITSIAAMQCVERGLLTLDEDIRPMVPELQSIDIIQGDAEGNVMSTQRNTKPITLRHLLTHTSGFAYDFMSPLVQAWRKQQPDQGPLTSVRKRFLHPLVFEPGTSWSYGPSIDWAGVVVENVTKSASLEDYMRKNIWEPLGIRDMTFFPSTRPDLQKDRAAMTWRGAEDVVLNSKNQILWQADWEDCQGGGGLVTRTGEYMKVLNAFLGATSAHASDSSSPPAHQLLRRSTANSMFEPNLNKTARSVLMGTTRIPTVNHMMGGLPLGTQKDWGLGGMLVQEDLPGWRRKTSMTWGGLPNLVWFVDREADLCGIYATQILPIGDVRTNETRAVFEKAIYARRKVLEQGRKSHI